MPPKSSSRPGKLCLLLLALYGQAAQGIPPATSWPRRSQQGGACGCQACVDSGSTAAQCASIGLDCACLVVCACQSCLDLGKTVDQCISFGFDCTGCDDVGGGGEFCGATVCVDDTSWISTFQGSCADYLPGGSIGPSYCEQDSGTGHGGLTQLASEACPVTCGTCPPTFVERQDAVNDVCCDEAAENCDGHQLPQLCNQECATLFLSFWNECQSNLLAILQHGISMFDSTVAMCQATAAACATTPCQNGAHCSAAGGSTGNGGGGHRRFLQAFACACLENYYGETCSTYCSPAVTCSGHGQCADSDGSCRCEPDYYGSSCDSFCENHNTCSGHGSCAIADDSVYCECATGWAGDSCDACAEGWSGLTCEHSTGCDENPCGAHGTCRYGTVQ